MNRILSLASAALFALAAWRVYYLSITWDEALSFLEYMQLNLDTPAKENTNLANHQLLNSWLGSLSTFLLGAEEWKIRLPSLLFYALYLWTSVKISLRMPSRLLQVLAFVLFHFSSYQNDFFCLARGYGMAMSLGTFSAYMLLRFAESRENRFLAYHLLTAMACTLANFTWAYFVAVSAAACLYLWWTQEKRNYKQLFLFVGILMVYGLFMVHRFLLLKKTGSLYFGGQPSELWMRTVQGLIDLRMGFIDESLLNNQIKSVLMMFLLAMGLFPLLRALRYNRKFEAEPLQVLAVFFIPSFALHALHVLVLGSLTFCDRTWTALFPGITLALIAACAAGYRMQQTAGHLMGLFLSLLLLTGFARMFAPGEVYEWRDEKDCKHILYNNRHLFSEKKQLGIGIDFCFEPQLEYYRLLWNLNYTPPNKNAGLQPFQDYYLINHFRTKPKENWQAIESMPGSGTWLYKNTQAYSLEFLTRSTPALCEASGEMRSGVTACEASANRMQFVTSKEEPYGKACLAKLRADSGDCFRIQAKLKMKNPPPGNDGEWVVDVKQGNEQLLYTGTHLKSLAPLDENRHPVALSYTFRAINADSVEIKCYPFTYGKHPMFTTDFVIEIFRIQAN
jgi:hypothetical protein